MAARPISDTIRLLLPLYGISPDPSLVRHLTALVIDPPDHISQSLSLIFGDRLTPQITDSISDLARTYHLELVAGEDFFQKQRREWEAAQSSPLAATPPSFQPEVEAEVEAEVSPQTDPQVENLSLMLTSYFTHAGLSISPDQAQTLANELTALKVANPDADFEALIEKHFLPKINAAAVVSEDHERRLTADLSQFLTDFDLEAQGRDLASQTITAELARAVSPDDARKIAAQISAADIDLHAFQVSQFATDPWLTQDELQKYRAEAFGEIAFVTTMENVVDTDTYNRLKEAEGKIRFSRAHAALSQIPAHELPPLSPSEVPSRGTKEGDASAEATAAAEVPPETIAQTQDTDPDSDPQRTQEMLEKKITDADSGASIDPHDDPGALGQAVNWLEKSETGKAIDSIAGWLPFYSGAKDEIKSMGLQHQALHGKGLTLKKRAQLLGMSIALDAWAKTQILIDVATFGTGSVALKAGEKVAVKAGEKVAVKAGEEVAVKAGGSLGKKALTKVGPGLTKAAGMVAEKSPETANFLKKMGRWTEDTLTKNPKLHDQLGRQLERQVKKGIKSGMNRAVERTTTSQTPDNDPDSDPQRTQEMLEKKITDADANRPPTPTTKEGKFNEWYENSDTAQKVGGLASLLPFVGGLIDIKKGSGYYKEAIFNKELDLGTRVKYLGISYALETWGAIQVGLDIVTLGGDKVALDIAEVGGKKLLTKVGPGLTKAAAGVAEKSPELAKFLKSMGLWTEKTLAENPQLHKQMGDQINKQVKKQVKSQIKKRTSLFQAGSQTPPPPSSPQTPPQKPQEKKEDKGAGLLLAAPLLFMLGSGASLFQKKSSQTAVSNFSKKVSPKSTISLSRQPAAGRPAGLGVSQIAKRLGQLSPFNRVNNFMATQASRAKRLAAAGLAAALLLGGNVLMGAAAAATITLSAITTAASDSVVGIFAAILAVPLVIAFMLHIITTGAYVIPPGGIPAYGYTYDFTPSLGGTGAVACTAGYQPLSFANTATNSIARRSWQIVNNLQCGFWNYWNRSPDYPQFFDAALFASEPYPCVYFPNYPPGCTGAYDRYLNLYWCTYLVLHAYNENGNSMPWTWSGGSNASANTMKNWFISQDRYLPISEALQYPTVNIKPGDVAIVNTRPTSPDYAGHVSIVWLVTKDVIVTIDSNAAYKTFSYTISLSGGSASAGGTMKIIGIGKQ